MASQPVAPKLTVEEYLRQVEHHARQEDGGWLMHEYAGVGASVPLPKGSIHIALADLYAPAIGLGEVQSVDD